MLSCENRVPKVFCASLHILREQPKLDNITGNIRGLKDVASFGEVNTDVVNINALVKRFGVSGKAYCVQHIFSET